MKRRRAVKERQANRLVLYTLNPQLSSALACPYIGPYFVPKCYNSAMEGGMDRRKFLEGTGGVLASALSSALPSLAEAAAAPRYLESSLTPESLERHKTRSAEALVADVWNDAHVREFALDHFFRDAQTPEVAQEKLRRSSTMAVPGTAELLKLRERSVYAEGGRDASAIDTLALQIPEGKYGLYMDGDTQRLYLLGNRGRAAEFVASFLISTSAQQWSNKPQSGGTPLGLHRMVAHQTGKLGQVLSKTDEATHKFSRVPIKSGSRTTQEPFVRSLNQAVDPAAIITDAFALWGPFTPLSRQVFVHGTNREDTLGARYSGGCVRMANVDAHILAGTDERGVPYVEVGALNKSGKAVRGGSPVMIHVSPSERSRKAPSLKPAWEANQPRDDKSRSDGMPPGFRDVTKE